MNWETALDLVIARTGHERFRVLCADAWPDHAGYRRLVLHMAGVRVERQDDSTPHARAPEGKALTLLDSPIPLAESLELLRLVKSCPYRSRDAASRLLGTSLRSAWGVGRGSWGE